MFSWHDFASLLTATYVLLFLAVAGVVVFVLRSWLWKLIGVLIVVAAFGAPLVRSHMQEIKRLEHNRMIAERFAKLCRENAGEKIFRTVEDVDGFLIMRPRKATKDHKEYMDQYWMGDPYGHSDLEAADPAAEFLADRRGFRDGNGQISPIKGYDFIELRMDAENKGDSKRYLRIEVTRRYTDALGQARIDFKQSVSSERISKYGYTWEDISSPDDRQYWIAGGRLRIVELANDQLVAERVGFVIDREQGARRGGGVPWLLAQRNACPPFESTQTKAKEFISKALKPRREKTGE